MIDPVREALRRCFHPRVFGERVVGRVPYGAQEAAMLCPHPRPINTTGRGSGKSTVLEGDDTLRKAAVIPLETALKTGSSRPVPMRVVLIGAVKEHAFELCDNIRATVDSHPWLRQLKSVDSTKTNVVLTDGTRIVIRPATNAARGQHAQTVLTKRGVVKGAILIKVDEGWFLRQRGFYQEVISPMLLMGGEGSQMGIYSTPYGQQGDVWEMWSDPRTGDCRQPYTLAADGRRVYTFDKRLCQQCLLTQHRVRHNFPTYENPYANRRELLETKRHLLATGRREVWLQEYCGQPSTTSGLFFTSELQELMWDDTLPEYQLSDSGEFVRRSLRSGSWTAATDDETGAAEEEYVDLTRLGGGEFYLGIDANQGIESRRADYAAISLVEVVRTRGLRRVYQRLNQRYRQAPEVFRGGYYQPKHVTAFLIAYAIFLIDVFRPRAVFIDQGFGQGVYVPLEQKYGERVVQYIPTSAQQRMRCLVHLRSMVEQGRFQSPPISHLMTEVKYLVVDQDSLDDDRVRIEKAAGWGTQGAEVDGLFALAYAMRGTEDVLVEARGSVSSQLDLTRLVGGLRGLPFAVRTFEQTLLN